MKRPVDRSRPSPPAKVDGGTIGLVVAFGVAWWFWDAWWLFPLRMLVVAAHEASHALTAIATGGEVVEVGLDIREGGHAITRGGIHVLVLNAGYLGSLLWGVALLGLTRTRAGARGMALLLGLGLVGMAAAWVRPVLSFGFAYALVAGLALGALGLRASEGVTRLVLRGVGVFSVLYAFLDVRDDVFFSDGLSDAALLARVTGIPAVVWGVLWCAAGLAVLVAAWRRLR